MTTEEKKVGLLLSVQELDYIANHLGKCPYGEVVGLVNKIVSQVNDGKLQRRLTNAETVEETQSVNALEP